MNSSPQFIKPERSVIIFTDLDGSLLDHNDYSYDAAQAALRKVKELHIPLIPVSSKTCAEIDHIFSKLFFNHPVIAENGAVIKVPKNYFKISDNESTIIHVGTSYDEINKHLDELKTKFAFSGFHDMSDFKVASITGLKIAEAERAKLREGSEPICWEDSKENFDLFKTEISNRGLFLTEGGRFFHVMGNNSKGEAIQTLLDIFKQNGFTPDLTLGLGDSENDISMLHAVNLPCVIKKHNGSYLQADLPRNAIYTENIGPAGWNECVMDMLRKQDATQ